MDQGAQPIRAASSGEVRSYRHPNSSCMSVVVLSCGPAGARFSCANYVYYDMDAELTLGESIRLCSLAAQLASDHAEDYMAALVRHAVLFSVICLFSLTVVAADEASPELLKREMPERAKGKLTIEEIRALLDSIDPYLPKQIVSGEIDLFGSTNMDVLAHAWANGFRKYHSECSLVISAEGSETVIDRLAKNHSSIGMMSRPVSVEDLQRLKAAGLKNPVAILIGREPLGVFVNKSNPMEAITYDQLVTMYCAGESSSGAKWKDLGVDGALSDKSVHIIGRDAKSGTRKFIETYLFQENGTRKASKELGSHAEVISAVAADPQAIAITGYKCNDKAVRRLKLKDKSKVIGGDEHEILLGHYPITRPLALVFDLGAEGAQAAANREFVTYALTRSGQTATILAGFYPYDPPTLRAELLDLGIQVSNEH